MGTLDLVGLKGREQRYPSQLSGGQQQRVALARSLALEPQLILLDEPLSNLDAKLREEMRVELKRLIKKVGISALYVTHDQEEAFTISDAVVVMDAGKILQYGAPDEIYNRPAHAFVASFIGHSTLVDGKVVRIDGTECVDQRAGVQRRESTLAGGAGIVRGRRLQSGDPDNRGQAQQ